MCSISTDFPVAIERCQGCSAKVSRDVRARYILATHGDSHLSAADFVLSAWLVRRLMGFLSVIGRGKKAYNGMLQPGTCDSSEDQAGAQRNAAASTRS